MILFIGTRIILGLAIILAQTPLKTKAFSWSNLPLLPKANLKKITANRVIEVPKYDPEYIWDLSKVAFSFLPLYPYNRRKTILEEIVKNKIWTLDQLQGIINVNVPVRTVVIRLEGGGLLVYNPVAPTKECIKYMRDLEGSFGPVRYIVLGTLGLEHKAFVGPFSDYFPTASVWVQPGQWSFPFDLPIQFLGFPLGKQINLIPDDSKLAPWKDDFDHAVLGPLKFKSVGGFGETALFHRASKTLLVTDTIVKVADKPSPILEDDPRCLLFHSRDSMLEDIEDTDDARLRGWRRMVLFGLTFFPGGIKVKGVFDTFSDISKVDRKAEILGEGVLPISGALYPWSWAKSELPSFRSLQGGLLVAPILRELILNREPEVVRSWVAKVSQWPIKRIIPSHLENNIAASGRDFKAAFSFLEVPKKGSGNNQRSPYALPEDLQLLKLLSDLFTRLGVVAPIPDM